MDSATLKDFKKRLTELEQHIAQKEKERKAEAQDANLDDLGQAREILDTIWRDTATQDADKTWPNDKENLNERLASLLILISQ